jgi:hypothetical protein
MLTEKLLKLLEAFPIKCDYKHHSILYDTKQQSLLLNVWIDDIIHSFYIEEHELDNMDKLISDIKDLHAEGT